MKREDDQFQWQNMALIRRVLKQTRKTLQNSGGNTYKDIMHFKTGLYSFPEERHPRAVCITHESLPEELEGGSVEEFPSCRFQHGGILASSTGKRMDILDIVDLNWSQYRTELWLPWLRYSDKLHIEGGFVSPKAFVHNPRYKDWGGSLYVSHAGPRLRDIVHKLHFVDHCITKNMTPPPREHSLLSDDGPRIDDTQKMVFAREGDAKADSSLQDKVRLLEPTQDIDVYVHYDHKDQRLLGPTTTLGKTDRRNLPYI